MSQVPDRHRKVVLMASIEEAKFRRPVRPGDALRMELTYIRKKATIAKMKGLATVDGVPVAEAIVMCTIAERG